MLHRFSLTLTIACATVGVCLSPGRGAASVTRRSLGPTLIDAHSPLPRTSALTRLLVSDMSDPSERLPQGVPPWWDWAGHPRTRPIAPMRGFRAFTPWGQLYPCAGTNPTGETVDLRDLQTWVLFRHSRDWRRIQFSSDMAGAAFAEDYVGPTVPAHYAPSAAGTSVRPVSGHNLHFWPSSGRVSLRASDVGSVTVAMEARLSPNSLPATGSCLVLSVGGDMWRSLTAPPGGSSSGDVGIGRFKRVEKRWRLFTMTTASPTLLNQLPLPQIAATSAEF